MDPSIMKLLEEDEDETMHSGADVDAFTAALNRDIEGDAMMTTQQSSESDGGNNHMPGQLFQPWQTSNREESASCPSEQEMKGSHIQDQQSSLMEAQQGGSVSENQHPKNDIPRELSRLPMQQNRPYDDFQQQQAEQNRLHLSQTMSMQNTEKSPGLLQEQGVPRNPESESEYQTLQRMSTQPMVPTGQAVNSTTRPISGKQVPFALLLPVIGPQLDKDRAMQLQTLYGRLKQNNISKEEFVRHLRSLVGDHMLKMAVYKLQQGQAVRNSESAPHQFPLSAQTSANPNLQQSSAKSSHITSSAAQPSADSANITIDTAAQKSTLMEHQSDSQGMQVSQMSSSNLDAVHQEREHPFPIQGLNKQQQQHLHFSQASFPAYGSTGGNYNQYSSANVNTSLQPLKQQPHDLQMRQGQVRPSMGSTHLGTTQAMNQMSMPKFERQNSFTDLKRVQGGALSHITNNSTFQQNVGHWQPSPHKDQSLVSSMAYVKQEPLDQTMDQQKSQLSTPQGLSSLSQGQVEQGVVPPASSKDESFEMQSARMALSTSINAGAATAEQSLSITAQLSARIPPITPPLGPGANLKAPAKKPSVGQKKPLEISGSSQPLPSKKQKVSGTHSDQSIEQLNDVTAVSGVNLREEEEQLFSGSKEDSRVSEASRRVVQEEEERLILQKVPLQKKLAEIMSKCAVKGRSNDVERCLSLCVEERMRGLISNLIRLSKQRVDLEKPRHRIVITSDVHQQIMSLNQKAREEWEKKQAGAEKLQRMDESEGNAGVDSEEGRGKSSKVNKDEDDKMRTTAANVAARAAVGGDDMMSRWQLMIEQNRQKREGVADAATTSQPIRDIGPKPMSAPVRNARDNQDADRRSPGSAGATPVLSRKFGRNQDISQSAVARSISVKDVISALEKEVQMSKSTFIYRLYDRMHNDAN